MSSIPCDVVLLPDEELEAKVIATSRHLKRNGTLFTLEEDEIYPHISIYMLQINSDNIKKVEKELKHIAARHKVLNLEATHYHQEENFFDIEYDKDKSNELANLQDAVVLELNELRDGMRQKDIERMQKATGDAKINYQEFGYKYVADLFRPHLSLTRFVKEQAEPELDLPFVDIFNGSFPKLGLFEMGDNGTCVKKIAEFELV